jgi:hypothetical protein
MPIPAVWYSKDLLLRADTAHPLDIEEAMLSHTRLPELDSYCVVRRLCQLHRTPTERDRRECDPDLGDRYVDLLESFKCRPDRNHPDRTTCDFASVANHCTDNPPHAQMVHISSSTWEGYRNSVIFPGRGTATSSPSLIPGCTALTLTKAFFVRASQMIQSYR